MIGYDFCTILFLKNSAGKLVLFRLNEKIIQNLCEMLYISTFPRRKYFLIWNLKDLYIKIPTNNLREMTPIWLFKISEDIGSNELSLGIPLRFRTLECEVIAGLDYVTSFYSFHPRLTSKNQRTVQ